MVKLVKSDQKEQNNQTGKIRLVKSATPPTVYNDRPSTPTEGGLTAYAKEKYALPTAGERVGSGVKSILNTAVATPALLFETGVETAKGLDDYLKDKWSKDTWKRVGEDFRYILGDRDTPRTEVKNVEISDYGKIDADSFGMKRMDKAMEQRAEATKGLSGTGAFLADTAIGLGQYASTLPLAIANPAAGLGAMASVSAAQKAYDVAKAGGSATEAYARGAAAGTIEALTEALPLDTLIDLYKKGGKPALKSIAKQLSIEPTEEMISYTANYLADKNAGDENAEFSAEGLGTAALGGLVSAGVMGAGTSAAGRLLNSNKKTALPTKDTAPKTMPTTAQESVSTQESVVTFPEAKTSQNEVIQPTQSYAPEEASVGAAPAGFEGNAVRGFSKNLATDTARHEEIQHEYQVNPQKYWRLGNKETLGKATAIMDTGIDNAVSTLEQALGAAQAGKKFAPEMVPLSKMVADELAAQGRVAEAERLLSAVAVELTEAGQLGQSAKILRDASPATRIQVVTKIVDKLNGKYKDANITVSEEHLSEYANAETPEAQSEALEKVKNDIASKVPSNWKDKWNAWRYLAMLGNPRTHARNVFGNAIFQPIRVTKDAVGTVLEKAVEKKSGGKIQRTKSFMADPELYKAAFADFENVKSDLSNNSKYNENIGDIESRKQVFELPLLEKARKKNTELLELEDTLFKKVTYADALAKYLKANGITAQQMADGTVPNELLSKARDYASNEAMRATFQDKNSVSDLVSKIGRYEGDKPAAKFISTIVEGVLPFRRTPANILVRGLEYNPVGLAKSLTIDLHKVKAGEMSAADAIDNVAKGITGTALFAAGAILAQLGIITPGKDSEEEQADLDALTGNQDYALNLPDGTSYTLDWAAPSALPFFMGAELAESVAENGFTSDGLFEALKSMSEPMLEMSMLQSLNDMIDSVSYADNKIGSLVTSALVSYLNQAVPTVGGQIERISEDKRMSTYTDRTLPMPRDAQYAIGKASARLPFDYQQIPYIDAWGREEKTGGVGQRMFENLVSPGYISKNNETAADKEIQRLLDAGQSGVVPNKPTQSVEVTYKNNPEDENNLKKNLTAEEYVKYSKVKGQTSYRVVSDLIALPEYKELTNEEKADVIKKVYTYAGHLASEEVTGGKHDSDAYVHLAKSAQKELGLSESEYLLLTYKYPTLASKESIRKAYANGVSPWEYGEYAQNGEKRYDKDNSGGVDMKEREKAISSSGLSEEKQLALWKLAYPDWVKKAEEKGIPFDVFVKIKLGKY